MSARAPTPEQIASAARAAVTLLGAVEPDDVQALAEQTLAGDLGRPLLTGEIDALVVEIERAREPERFSLGYRAALAGLGGTGYHEQATALGPSRTGGAS